MKQTEFEGLSRRVLSFMRKIHDGESLLKLSCTLLDAELGLLVRKLEFSSSDRELARVYPAECEETIEPQLQEIVSQYKHHGRQDEQEGISLGMPFKFLGKRYSDVLIAFGGRPGVPHTEFEMILFRSSQHSELYYSYHCWAATELLREFGYILMRREMARDLKEARNIQQNIIPSDVPGVPGWLFAQTFQPARQTSGDFFDYITLPNGKLGVLIADAAGKGMGASLIMSQACSLFRTYAPQFCDSTDLVMEAVNYRLLRDNQDIKNVPTFYGILDPDTGCLTYSNAGHDPQLLLIQSPNGTIRHRSMDATGIPLGMFSETKWGKEVVTIPPDGFIVLYTDGIVNTRDTEGSFYGSDKLLNLLYSNYKLNPNDLQRVLLSSISDFGKGCPPFDDITLLIIRRNPAV